MTLDELRDGETLYAYTGNTITSSLPPISNAKLVLGRIAADYAVPSYYEVQAAVHSQDGKSTTISTVQGTELQIEESTT